MDRLDERASILKQLLLCHAGDLDGKLLELANQLVTEGRDVDAIALLESAESMRAVSAELNLLHLQLLEAANQTVDLLSRLDAMGDDASPAFVKKRLMLRANSLGDWVGTFVRLCGLLSDPKQRTLGYDVLSDTLPHPKAE